MVFYLKYRPQKFSQLDIKIVRERLINIFSSGKIPHAFLFSGPRGTGKTSAARIVAKAVNCEKRKESSEYLFSTRKSLLETPGSGHLVSSLPYKKGSLGRLKTEFEPCNQCESCQAITTGRHLDVLEIDAASNRGIDEIRDLRERIKLSPSQARKKVYIIDEVHMLTAEAFNALLKTLEEPPKHAIFILATTQVHKLPETITSRCVRIDFRKADTGEILRSLERIVKGEGLEAEKNALEFIAKFSDGSFREGAKILEESSILGKVTLEGVKKILGKDKDYLEEDLLNWLAKKETKKALEWIEDAGEKGADFLVLTKVLLENLHQILLGKFEVGKKRGEEGKNKMIEELSVEDLKKLIKIFSRAYQELKIAAIPSLPLELAVVEWCEKTNEDV